MKILWSALLHRATIITLNKNSTRAFQRAIKQGSALPLTSSKWV